MHLGVWNGDDVAIDNCAKGYESNTDLLNDVVLFENEHLLTTCKNVYEYGSWNSDVDFA